MKHMDPSAFVNAVPLEKPKMTLQDLSALLRNPDNWPRGFVWDYSFANCCAIGLVRRYDPSLEEKGDQGWIAVMSDYFDMPWNAANDIFCYANEGNRFFGLMDSPMTSVKPKRVAKLIDRYLGKAA